MRLVIWQVATVANKKAFAVVGVAEALLTGDHDALAAARHFRTMTGGARRAEYVRDLCPLSNRSIAVVRALVRGDVFQP